MACRRLLGGAVPYATLDEEAAAVPIGCQGLTCQEHFQARRAGFGPGLTLV